MKSLIPQYGIGIELRKNSLVAIFAKRTLGRFRIVDRLAIEETQSLGAAACGQTYERFLSRHGLKAPWTVVAIPRQISMLREVKLPASVARELASVIALQVDSLHPFGEGDVVWDCTLPAKYGGAKSGATPVGKSISAIVALAQRTAILELSDWFKQAGIPISQFASSPMLLRTASERVRALNSPDVEPSIVAYSREDGWDLVGSSADHPVVTRDLPLSDISETTATELLARVTRELDNLSASLRIDKSSRPRLFVGGDILTQPELLSAFEEELGERYQVTRLEPDFLAVSAARSALRRGEDVGINLLPADQRHYESPAALIPSYGLAAAVLLLGVGLGLRGTLQDWQYSRRLDAEIAALRPRVTEIEALRDRSGAEYQKLLRLAAIREETRVPLEVLEELTKLLPDDAWLQQVQMDGSTLTLSGTAASASGVLQAFSEGTRIESPQFLSAISRSNDGKEGFRIGVRLRAGVR